MHIARKRFGQHFLHDKQIIQRIVEIISPQPGEHLVEIGPGQGALTVPLLKKIGRLEAIEIDYSLIPALEKRCADLGSLTIYQGDVLNFNFATLARSSQLLRIVGNLPYNISTPLIFHLMQFSSIIADMHFMLQKEVVERMAAAPNEEAYGRLSIMLQYHCKVFALLRVPAEAFSPAPQVQSSIVRLVPRKTALQADDYANFAYIVREAFNHRRKTLRNCLKKNVTESDWQALAIDARQRPEQLGIEDYIKISNYLVKNHSQPPKNG